MADFNLLDEDEDYACLFITQSSNEQKCISLEEDEEKVYKTVHNSDYSDVSDDDNDMMDERLRHV